MSEQTDALVVVISEENQSISAEFDASIRSNLSIETLGELIRIHLGARPKEPTS